MPVAPDPLLDDLDPEQRTAVLSDGAPLCIVAPAGSGKTRVLTRRIARRIRDGSADPSHVLVITFTRRAAGELAGRLRALGPRDAVAAGTFHGLAYRLLRQRWEDQRRRAPALAVSRLRLVEEALGDLRRLPRRGAAQEVASEIDWARARRVGPPAYAGAAAAAGRRTALGPAEVAELYERYEALKRERRVVDFDDLLSLVVAEMARDGAYADAVRWRYRHLFVDEYQDVNPLQQALLEAWRGGRPDLCVVGDPQQAIYGWNGADGRWLEDFTAHHPGATVVHLRRSHRSTPQIVGLGHAVLTGSGEGGPVASRPDGAPPRAIAFTDPEAEAAGVAAIVRDVRPPGGRWSAIAVLARTNAQLQPVAAALTRAGIPHRRRAGPIDDPATAAALVELRSVTGPGSLRTWLEDTLGGAAGPTRTEDSDGPTSPRRGRSGADPAAGVRAGGRGPPGAGPRRGRAHAAGLAHLRRRRPRRRRRRGGPLDLPRRQGPRVADGRGHRAGARARPPHGRPDARPLATRSAACSTSPSPGPSARWSSPGTAPSGAPTWSVLDLAEPAGATAIAPPPDLRPVPNRAAR